MGVPYIPITPCFHDPDPGEARDLLLAADDLRREGIGGDEVVAGYVDQ